eukprot:jgi/Tetstr1/427788/TSEL_017906.t1
MSVKVAGVELSDAEVAEFREVFDLVDKDRGGTIQADEVLELMQMLGMKPSKADVERMISEIDEDGNGEVDFSEFLQLEEALTRYCGDTMKPEEIKRLVHAIEPRDDGLINYEEKINMFVSK